ncbi:hypothetical protein [Methylobacter tundripaludum]|nr:hypothetical protein [Methylobacter tundripaludum]
MSERKIRPFDIVGLGDDVVAVVNIDNAILEEDKAGVQEIEPRLEARTIR